MTFDFKTAPANFPAIVYAFPQPSDIAGRGMTLRDYFAAKCIQGMLASNVTLDIDGDLIGQKRSELAYALADAMLKAREA